MNALVNRLLHRYEDTGYELWHKSRFMLMLALAMIVIYGAAWFYTVLMAQADPFTHYSLMQSAIGAGMAVTIIGAVLIVTGRFGAGSHTILIGSFLVIWVVMILDKTPVLSRLNTVSFVIALLSLVAMATRRRAQVFLWYTLFNSLALCAYLYYFRHELDLPSHVLVDHLGGSILSMIGVALVGYNVFAINRRAVERARHEIGVREEAEAVVRANEERYRLLADNVSDIIFMANKELQLTYVSPSVQRLRGFTVEEALRQRPEEIIAPESLSRLYAAFGEEMIREHDADADRSRNRSIELEEYRKDGSLIWTETTFTAIRDEQGAIVSFMGITRDITDKKRLELEREAALDALTESEENYRRMIETSLEGIMRMDREHRIIYANEQFIELVGYSYAELDAQPAQMLFFPEDLADYRERLALRRAGVAEVYERRFRRRNGTVVWAIVSAVPVFSAGGEFAGSFAMLTDITKRKETEDELRKLTRAVEQSPICIVVTDITGAIEYVNPQFSRVTGYRADEVLGQTPRILKSGRTSEREYRELWQTILAGEVWAGEFHNRKKNGELYWESAAISPVRDARGNITHFVAVKEDITEQKRSREALRMNEARLNSLLSLSQKISGLSETDIFHEALEEAERLTESEIGYCHLVNEDQETIELVTWSRETLKNCAAAPEKHYPFSQAGIWADCARLRRPVVHNDYPANQGKKGLPEGHAPLYRHISVPVIENNGVQMIMGLGNKSDPYDDADVRQLQLIANDTWKIVCRKRAENEQRKLTAIIETSSDFICIGGLDGRIGYVNEAGQRLLGIASLHEAQEKRLFDFFVTGDAERLSLEIIDRVYRMGSWTGEVRLRHFAQEKTIPVEMNAFIIRQASTGEPIAMASISRDITERKRSEMALIELAASDPLTGIYNRRRFFELSSALFKQSLLRSQNLSVLMIDVDNFKSVNDLHGHAVGDQVLTGIVSRLRSGLRDTDVLGRYGGEEFVILMPGADRQTSMLVAERLCDAMRQEPVKTERKMLMVTISIGVAVLAEDRDLSIDDLVRRADEALYCAKQSGRDRVCFWVEPPNYGEGSQPT